MSDGCKSKLPVIPRGNEKSKETVCAVVVEIRRIDLHKNVGPHPTSNAVLEQNKIFCTSEARFAG